FSTYRHPRVLPSFPTRRSSDLVVGPRARDTLPAIEQYFFAPESATDDFESLLFRVRKRVEQNVPGTYVCSLSTRTVLLDGGQRIDRKSTRLNSSHVAISYAVFC